MIKTPVFGVRRFRHTFQLFEIDAKERAQRMYFTRARKPIVLPQVEELRLEVIAELFDDSGGDSIAKPSLLAWLAACRALLR
jgi:hypothetical protein